MFRKIFMVSLTDLVNGCNHTKCVNLSHQKCMHEFTLIHLHPNEYIKEFQYYLFAVKLDIWVGSCNALNDLSNKIRVPNKADNKDEACSTWLQE